MAKQKKSPKKQETRNKSDEYIDINNLTSEKTKHLEYGSILFGVGLLIILIGSFFTLNDAATKATIWILTVLGLVIGYLNITRTEAVSFIVAGVAVILLLGQFLLLVNQYIELAEYFFRFVAYLNALLVPAIVIVSLRTIFRTAKDKY